MFSPVWRWELTRSLGPLPLYMACIVRRSFPVLSRVVFALLCPLFIRMRTHMPPVPVPVPAGFALLNTWVQHV